MADTEPASAERKSTDPYQGAQSGDATGRRIDETF